MAKLNYKMSVYEYIGDFQGDFDLSVKKSGKEAAWDNAELGSKVAVEGENLVAAAEGDYLESGKITGRSHAAPMAVSKRAASPASSPARLAARTSAVSADTMTSSPERASRPPTRCGRSRPIIRIPRAHFPTLAMPSLLASSW